MIKLEQHHANHVLQAHTMTRLATIADHAPRVPTAFINLAEQQEQANASSAKIFRDLFISPWARRINACSALKTRRTVDPAAQI
jgi:hypothetical protein